MITPYTSARLARLGLAVSALVAVLLGWTRTGEDVPEDSPARARGDMLGLVEGQIRARDRLMEGLEADLAAGRIPLREAARTFSDYLEREPNLGVDGVRPGRECAALHPGASPEERCARWLLRRVQKRQSGAPEAEGMARLERELAEAYGDVAAGGDLTDWAPRSRD
jgi:hypothetical protein